MSLPQICDPLKVNIQKQTRILLSKLPADSPYAETLRHATSTGILLDSLSRLLSVSFCTIIVATTFRPLLIDLCARWLHSEGDWEDRLVALCLLIEPHEELYPVLSQFLRKVVPLNGPLSCVMERASPSNLEAPRLHRLLLAYYRLLQANRNLPQKMGWPLEPLSKLFTLPHPDTGVCFLAIRCYTLHSGMAEFEREKLETEVLGELYVTDCNVDYGQNEQGVVQIIDAWTLPALEIKRITDARNNLLSISQDYFTDSDNDSNHYLQPTDLSPLISNIHGVFLLREPGPSISRSRLVTTPTAIHNLRHIALCLSLRLPILLTSAPSAGKSCLLRHLASVLFPGIENQIVTIHLADTSLDARSLLGSYVSSSSQPGSFDWKEGVLVRAMREGRWVMLKDVDKASNDVLGLLKPLVESMGLGRWIGASANLEVPSRGWVEAHENFSLFALRSLDPSRIGKFSEPSFLGAHKFHEIVIQPPTSAELVAITENRFPRLAGAVTQALIGLWEAVRGVGVATSARGIGLRELEKYCVRMHNLLFSYPVMEVTVTSEITSSFSSLFPNISLREEMFLEARDVFFGAGVLSASARLHVEKIANIVADYLGLDSERRSWVLLGRTPEFDIEADSNGAIVAVRLGRSRLIARPSKGIASSIQRPFATHRPAIQLLTRIATAVSLSEPVLLTGETGTGKTSVVTHLASLLRTPLVTVNLSHQTETLDLVGGFKPVDTRVPGSVLQDRFIKLFGSTFSRKKNAAFEESARKAVGEGKWNRAVGLWKEAIRLAKEKILERKAEATIEHLETLDNAQPRKRRKVDVEALAISEGNWDRFKNDVDDFEIQHVLSNGKLSFAFVDGPLIKALKTGNWILLDEINLSSPETLECLGSLLEGPTGTITLTEHGFLEPVPRHPNFRLFACMNPATDVGKKELPPNIRCRFTEIDVPAPDADRETLLAIVTQYIGLVAVGDKAVIMNIAEFYVAVKQLAEERQIADGSNRRPHYSMRTLARALTFAADMATVYGLRRALWEGCLMAFTMVLDGPSAEIATTLMQRHILTGVRNPRSLLARPPAPLSPDIADNFIRIGPFYLEKGPLQTDLFEDYIMTPSVEKKLIDLARIVSIQRFPILIEGPTSSGKTSSVEYLAHRTGHTFVRVNNHDHTDIQEYIGSYVSDPATGKLVFRDGLLVRALRAGHWIVLDELNLAPTDVLEALNRLLDDNRELLIPETHEVVRPHPHFMLFATQNPPGLYAGRKILSRAFRNRFLEVQFDDVPQSELETILCQRCRIAPSYGRRIVSVFRELQTRRQSSRVFESKHGFATLRDLFRWASRDALGYQELAENGYMLLAERARRPEDKAVVKEVIESVMNVKINEETLYDWNNSKVDYRTFLGCDIPSSTEIVWTTAMRRLFTLVSRALRFKEPVLLVGETGCGKTSICAIYANVVCTELHCLNCHQNTETADMIGGLRPVRNRVSTEADLIAEVNGVLDKISVTSKVTSLESAICVLDDVLHSRQDLADGDRSALLEARRKSVRLNIIFEWYDGPLIKAMRNGDVFLLDEISLADDSVLERLNSVLEPARTLVLAENGGDDLSQPVIQATDGFSLIATMNPGGDYGKKELSPALRNRFTEIWVPPVTERKDLELIVDNMWQHKILKDYTHRLLDFVDWLCSRVGDRSVAGLRDILAWVSFSNSTLRSECDTNMLPDEIFRHAACLTFLDGLGSLPQLNSFTGAALRNLRAEALTLLHQMAPLAANGNHSMQVPVYNPALYFQLDSFAIPRGPKQTVRHSFNLQAETTRENAVRIIRACQLQKPVLLEGSPGVGKTTLISALANLAGFHLCRVNLSDQTDLADLFGSDLPVEGGQPGEFVWKDAEFLRALQQGHWVLLDEMNLAPQTVLEGLNAVLDHRGTVYIPELGRSFVRHPQFRVFAAQNPLIQGGGRKGLPKSFVNRFTKVFIEELSPNDLLVICKHIFPQYDSNLVNAMVAFNSRLHDEIVVKRSFARNGSPWEFNLRDIVRWISLVQANPSKPPGAFLRTAFLHRLRTTIDRDTMHYIFQNLFPISTTFDGHDHHVPHVVLSSESVRIGTFIAVKKCHVSQRRAPPILQSHVSALESLGNCVTHGWLAIVTGPSGIGKSNLVRTLANITGNFLHVVPVNSATDTMDLLGSFEQVDSRGRALLIAGEILSMADKVRKSTPSVRFYDLMPYHIVQGAVLGIRVPDDNLLTMCTRLMDELVPLDEHHSSDYNRLSANLSQCVSDQDRGGRFEWVDGPLIRAMRYGHWLLLDDANLCSPSVLDRLNSLCEPDGSITLSERGQVNGDIPVVKPHAEFRLFMTVDPRHGELSRAMRNRGIEIALTDESYDEDKIRVLNHCRLPLHSMRELRTHEFSIVFDMARRGIHGGNDDSETGPTLWPSGYVVDQDSASSVLVSEASLLATLPSPQSIMNEAMFFVIPRIVTYHQIPLFKRFLHNDRNFQEELFLPTIELILGGLANLPLLPFVIYPQWKNDGSKPLSSSLAYVEVTDAVFAPFDIRQETAIPLEFLLQILNLSVTIKLGEQWNSKHVPFDDHSKKVLSSRTKVEQRIQEAMAVVDPFHKGLVRTGQGVLARICTNLKDEELTNVEKCLVLMRHVRFLRELSVDSRVNYSAIYLISSWISFELQEPANDFGAIVPFAKTLHNALSLSSGQGLREIWTALFVEKSPTGLPSAFGNLEDRVSSLKWDISSFGLRTKLLQLMALKTLPSVIAETEIQAVIGFSEEVEQRLPDGQSYSTENRQCNIEISVLIAELGVLCIVAPLNLNSEPNTVALQNLLELICNNSLLPLSRLVPYQHLFWALTVKKDVLSLIAQTHIAWLTAIWTVPASYQTKADPRSLLRPLHLISTVALCRNLGTSLSALDSLEATMWQNSHLAIANVGPGLNTIRRLNALFFHSVLMVSSCFSDSFEDFDIQMVKKTHDQAEVGSLTLIPHIVKFLETSTNAHLRRSFLTLKPLLCLLGNNQSRSSQAVALGKCWIALSRVLLTLYVPDLPIDPVAASKCETDYWKMEEQKTLSEIYFHREFERRTTGNDDNPILAFLERQLLKTRSRLSKVPYQSTLDRPDALSLRTFWTEVLQFIDQVISSDKVEPLLSALVAGTTDASMREEVLQESLSGFLQRLVTTYPSLKDLIVPLELAILYFKLGVRIVSYGSSCRSDRDSFGPIVHAVVSFPRVRSAELINSLSSTDTTVLPILQILLLKLSSLSFVVSLGADADLILPLMQSYCDQIVRLRLAELARDNKAEEESKSLYRRKTVSYDAALELEDEEQDFLTLFPDFDLVMDQGMSLQEELAGRTRVESLHSERLVGLHREILVHLNQKPNVSYNLWSDFTDARRQAIETLADACITLPDTLDEESLSFQLSLSYDKLMGIHTPVKLSEGYNFYVDANVQETTRVFPLLAPLMSRLDTLMADWPEQMVLQNLRNKCDVILQLDVHSSVAKILTALDQLLIQSEDWEMYANRENTLRYHWQALTNLVVDWRRLELSSWQGLLLSQKRAFINACSDSWFSLYDVLVRGSLSIDAAHETSGSEALNSHLRELVPLLDDFISSSSLGQYEERMRMLEDFSLYVNLLAVRISSSNQAALQRVHRILLATISYYRLFSERITRCLHDQQLPLEKEIRDYIKLASWKDVNVQALRQSAQQTHRRLYKTIRKYREILRQPVSVHFNVDLAGDAECRPMEPDIPGTGYVPANTQDLPESYISSTLPAYLINISRTYMMFEDILRHRIQRFSESFSPESIEELCIEIVSGARDLAAVSISNALSADQRQKRQKALLVRKRKAYSDLLKELKRAGFSLNIKPQILQRQNDSLWMREQPQFMNKGDDLGFLSKGEKYFNLIKRLLPQLRSRLANHHPDVNTRELQRGIMLLESALSIALEIWSSLASMLEDRTKVKRTLLRLQMVKSDARVSASGLSVHKNAHKIKDLLCKLADALDESAAQTRVVAHFHKLSSCPPPGLQSHLTVVRDIRDRVVCLVTSVDLTDFPILLEDEKLLLSEAATVVSQTSELLSQWSEFTLETRHIFSSVRKWLQDAEADAFEMLTEGQDRISTPLEASSNAFIDVILVNVQSLLKECHASDYSSEEDNHIRRGTSVVSTLTRRLSLDVVLTRLKDILPSLASSDSDQLRHHLNRFLPFLHTYDGFVNDQLTRHGQWVNSLFKLVYVVASIMETVGRDGFCQPPEAEETSGDTGDKSGDASGGVGLGEGEGSENVSKEIEEESQVEGLQGEASDHQEVQNPADDDAIEMGDDFEGDMQDIENSGSEGDEESGNDEEVEEKAEGLDAADPSAVDEKLWGDESGPQDDREANEQLGQDRAQESTGKSEMVAKEQEGKAYDKDNQHEGDDQQQQQEQEDDEFEEIQEGDPQEDPGVSGAPMDNHIPDADTLAIPDDMEIGQEKDAEESNEDDVGLDEAMEMDEAEDGPPPETGGDAEMDAEMDPSMELGDTADPEEDVDGIETDANAQPGSPVTDDKEDISPSDYAQNGADKSANLTEGTSAVDQTDVSTVGDGVSQGQQAGPAGLASSEEEKDAGTNITPGSQVEETAHTGGEAVGSMDASQTHDGGSAQHEEQLLNNPLRSLGDALKEIQQRFHEILGPKERPDSRSGPGRREEQPSQLEYVAEDDADEDMQALGPSGEEQAAKLGDLKMIEQNIEATNTVDPIDIDPPDIAQDPVRSRDVMNFPAEQTSQNMAQDSSGAISQDDIRGPLPSNQSVALGDSEAPKADVEMEDVDDSHVEVELRNWQGDGSSSEGAEHIWKLYESLTRDLAYALCEQLRLILEPTRATRLRGDYRTGKRLNMKKVISYIASDYTKDKIWLRRTRPSQREYQVLLALDDSRSMAESHSIHLAFETLALISTSLNRLEVGDIGIVKFGESVDVLHGFEDGPFTDQAGTKVMSAFRFHQKATNVLSLLQHSLTILESAREHRAVHSSSAADLWQLQIIISDGICQDHDSLRALLRQAQEQRVLIVFIIVDSLHTTRASGTESEAPDGSSILAMKQVGWKNVNGTMEMQLQRYMDTFPFEYYVVLRNVEALPAVLSSTLKQFFERISEE